MMNLLNQIKKCDKDKKVTENNYMQIIELNNAMTKKTKTSGWT